MEHFFSLLNNRKLLNFRSCKANDRRIRRIAKRESWTHYISSINSYTDASKVYNRVHKLKRQLPNPVPLVNDCGDTIEEQANTLGEHFEKISSSENYTAKFLRHKSIAESVPLRPDKPVSEGYNKPLTLHELKLALGSCGSSAPGSDTITYEMIGNLPDETLNCLLALYNKIFNTGKIPSAWKEAIVLPILKQGKDPSSVNSYRPIALTSCLLKVFEKMINRRLVYYLEYNGILDPCQSGFRTARSTTDNLVLLESYIRNAFVHNQYCLSVFFDLEKAYDTAWRYGILQDLSSFGICGRLITILRDYLSESKFRVRIGSSRKWSTARRSIKLHTFYS